MERFVFRNIDSLELIENLLIAMKEKIRESNFSYTPPFPVAFLIGALPKLKEIINLYRLAKKIEEDGEVFMEELQHFGLTA